MSDKNKMTALSADAGQPTRKKADIQHRWKSKAISFRVSPEENELINIAVSLSGLTKQEYITKRLIDPSVVIVGNPRMFKAFLEQMEKIYWQLRRIEAGNMVDDELLTAIYMISEIMDGIRKEAPYDR